MPAEPPPPGLSETRFGLRYYVPDIHTLFDVVDLRRKSGELWAELTVRCRLEGVRGQVDGDRLRQGNINLSSIATRQAWAKALGLMVPDELNRRLDWGNVLERLAQEVLDHERRGSLHGGVLTGAEAPVGRPWAAYPILPDGEVATLYGRGGVGKTALVATLVVSLGLGRSLIPGVRVDRPYRVALLDWETNRATSDHLVHLVAASHGVRPPDTVWYEPMEQPFERTLPKVAQIMEVHRADLVVIDSAQMAMLSSSDGGDAAESITRLHQALRRLGTWGLLVDHVASEDLRSSRAAVKPYGSVFKSNIARHAINLHVTERTGDTSRAYLICTKSNLLRDRWAMEGVFERGDDSLRWDFAPPDYELYDRLTSRPEAEVPPLPPPDGRLADRIAAVLEAAGPLGVAEIVGRLGLSGPRDEAKVRTTLHRYREAFARDPNGLWDQSD